MTDKAMSAAIGACPLDCPDGCSWIVELEDGQPKKLRGNPDHPFTGKTLCAKTLKYLDEVNHPERLLYPMRRVGAKGSGAFERISWDEAIDEIAGKLQSAIDDFGSEAILPYAGTGTVGLIQGMLGGGKRLFHALGASRHNPNICSMAGHAGMKYTMGSAAGMDPEDLTESKLILLWATNTVETNQHLWPFIRKAQKENNAKVVSIDPIRTETAKRADFHLPLHPGTDGALVLGLIHQLVRTDAVNADYLGRMTVGWEGFRDTVVKEFSVEKAAEVCRLPADDIRKLAAWIAESPPMGIKTAMGLQQHRGGGQAARVLSCLPAVMGSFERPGGGMVYSTGPTYKFNYDALCRPDLQPGGPRRELAMTRLGRSLLETDDPPVKFLFLWGANPVASNPGQGRVRKGLAREDLFTVVIENFRTDTADYADIILPGTMQTEHADLHDSFSHMYIQWNEPVAEPRGECLPHTEIFRRVAAAMNLSEPALFADDETIARELLDSGHPAMSPISLESLKERGWARLNYERPFLPFVRSFPTASGKFEFESAAAEADGHGRFPHFVPPREALKSGPKNSFALVTSASKRMLNSIYGNRNRNAAAGSITISIHPGDADRLSLSDGSKVRVFNQRGEYRAVLICDDKVQPGVAHTPKGYWPRFNGGASANAVVAEDSADMADGPMFKDIRVEIEAAS